MFKPNARLAGWLLLAFFLTLTIACYAPGLSGGFFFDDYPNIVDNSGIAAEHASLSNLTQAALSSPSSDLKRPLASLTFAANYLSTGLDPRAMKATNIVFHLINGILLFVLVRQILCLEKVQTRGLIDPSIQAALVAGAWMILPINLTSVLYIVQRMESMANLFVLVGLIGYIRVRQSMQDHGGLRRSLLAALCIIIPTAMGILAKETAIMLPLYAACVEAIIFRFCSVPSHGSSSARFDKNILAIFFLLLLLPLVIGISVFLPHLLEASGWSSRNYVLTTRLYSEARIVVDYIAWIVFPTPEALSFYHDDFAISKGWLTPWTTLTSTFALVTLAVIAVLARRRVPLFSLGISFYFGCHLLTGTILPLELIYEHRNYFASIGLLIAALPLLQTDESARSPANIARWLGVVVLISYWSAQTAATAAAWGSPLGQAEELARRAPMSPRAQYELGRTYIIYSKYNPLSPFAEKVYEPLERSASLPNSSILAEQALIFYNSRMHRPLKDTWWISMAGKLRDNRVSVQDESALGSLVQCARQRLCDLPNSRLLDAFLAALSHPQPTARLLAMYGDFSWNLLGDRVLGERMTASAVLASPSEPAYRITHLRMLIAMDRKTDAQTELQALQRLNFNGRIKEDIEMAKAAIDAH